MRLRACVFAAALALVAAPLTAQQPGTVELGLFSRMTWFDDANPISEVPPIGIGARLGVFPIPNLALEVSGSYSDTHIELTEDDVNYLPLRGLAVLNIPAGDVIPMIGAGFSMSRYSGAIDETDTGISGLLGIRAYYTDRTSVRTEVTLDYISSPFNEGGDVDRHLNWGWQLGLSYALSGGRAADSDGDGVSDNRDRCPGTPRGEPVGLDGCPLDGDGDGVSDSADRCADTPAGVRVDANGCAVDTDRDGVADHMDRCANTASGASVDANGCEVDGDGDGVPDSRDRCSNTPSGTSVDANGCPRDSDGDGVPDARDRCANTPQNADVDANGCPTDSDNDGVPDGIDRCADTEAGADVDARGCPVLFATEEETTLVLEGVTFETGSAELTASARSTLNVVAESLNGNPDVRVEVAGHTDNTGSRAFNVQLSQDRAESVRSYLQSRGVTASRMEARGYGPDEPTATNATAAGRQQNRRVELRRLN